LRKEKRKDSEKNKNNIKEIREDKKIRKPKEEIYKNYVLFIFPLSIR
jgi:hypothetical protein